MPNQPHHPQRYQVVPHPRNHPSQPPQAHPQAPSTPHSPSPKSVPLISPAHRRFTPPAKTSPKSTRSTNSTARTTKTWPRSLISCRLPHTPSSNVSTLACSGMLWVTGPCVWRPLYPRVFSIGARLEMEQTAGSRMHRRICRIRRTRQLRRIYCRHNMRINNGVCISCGTPRGNNCCAKPTYYDSNAQTTEI
jgi:hypothetical protein